MFKGFLLKTFLKSKLKGVPESDIDKVIAIVEKDPEFFKQLGERLQVLTSSGMSQDEAVRKIFTENSDRIKSIVGNS